MSYEPDTNDIRLRQLAEQIAEIREEQFARALPTNQGGGANVVGGGLGVSAPTTGVTSWVPNVIRITKDTGVIDKIAYRNKSPTKDFSLGGVITGQLSGATATIGDIDLTGTDTGFLQLVQGSITGTFQDGENLNEDIAGTNVADVELAFGTTQIGRGHLNAGSASIIVDTLESPAEIHFIDNAQTNGQIVLLRAQNGLTIRVRRAQTSDGATGNLDLDESFNLIENALVFLQYQATSNVTPDGGWVPLITDITTVAGGTGGGISFPILYPKDELGNVGNQTLILNLNQANGHYKRITLTGDVGLTFETLPPSTVGFKFYLETTQDSTGGHVYTALPTSVINAGTLLGQLQTASDAKTLWQFSTADGGLTWHSQVIQAQGAGGDNLGNHTATEDLKMATFDITNLDVLKYADGTQPGADGFIGVGQWGSAVENDTTLKWSIPASTFATTRQFEWRYDGVPAMTLFRNVSGQANLNLYESFIKRTLGIQFTHFNPIGSSDIKANELELQYINGFVTGSGGFHGFHVGDGGAGFAQFEVREEVIRANVNLDMITNNIFDVDVVEWASTGGFLAGTNHGIRSIGGGNTGLEMNVPKDKTFRMLIENIGQTDSDIQYEFTQNEIFMHNNQIKDVLAIRFSNLTSFVDFGALNFEIIGGLQNANVPDSDPQNMIFRIQQKVGFDTYVTRDVFTMTGSEFFADGGMKMHTDLNMQTQNINNIDVLKFVQDGGEILDDEFAIGVDVAGVEFNFHVPINKNFAFREDNESIAFLNSRGLFLQETPLFPNPEVSAREFALSGVHSGGASGTDGSFRLIDNAGSLDIIVVTGGSNVNLSNIGSSFIGFNADDDLRMNTFNITGVDVLRFQVDGGVIGFGEYGISTDPFSMNFSTPSGLGYTFLNNLDPIAFLNKDQFQLLGNNGNPDPSFFAREYVVTDHSQGTFGLVNGAWRKVGDDVIVRSGGINVNLTSLSAGGADDLGSHIATQSLDLGTPSNAIINFSSMSSTFGHSMFWTTQGMVFNIASLTSDSYSWLGGGSTEMMTLTNSQLNVHDKRITNVLDPTSNLDAVNLQTLNGAVGGGGVQLGDSPTWTGAHIFDGGLTSFSGSINFGNDVNDFFTVNGRFLSPLIPFINKTNLGSTSQRWDVFASDLSLQNGFTVNNISNSSTNNNVFSLMTSSAIQDAITAGAGGGDFANRNLDNLFTTAINVSLTPVASVFDLGTSGTQWRDLFITGKAEIDALQLTSGSTVSVISNSSTNSGSSTLLTASAIQTAISNAGGGDFANRNLSNLFTTSINVTLKPVSSFQDLGTSGTQWRNLFITGTAEIDALHLTSGNTVSTISNSVTAFGSSTLMTATAIQNAILNFGSGVGIGDDPIWTGSHQWTNTATFQSALNVNGTMTMFGALNHDGSTVGFYGKFPVTRSNNWVVSGGPIDKTLFVNSANTLEVAEVLGTLIRQLIRVGIIGT